MLNIESFVCVGRTGRLTGEDYEVIMGGLWFCTILNRCLHLITYCVLFLECYMVFSWYGGIVELFWIVCCAVCYVHLFEGVRMTLKTLVGWVGSKCRCRLFPFVGSTVKFCY